MTKSRIINIFDKIFVLFTIFLIIYAWINFYIRNLFITFLLSLIFSFACVFVIYYFLDKKALKLKMSKKEVEKIETCFNIFNLYPYNEKLNLLKSIFSKDNKAEIINDKLVYIVDKPEVKLKITHLVIIATQFECLNQQNLINLINEYTQSKYDYIDIVCNEYAPNLNLNLLTNIKINLINKTKLYKDIFEKNSVYPEIKNINTEQPKVNFKELFLNFFQPNKAKKFFICGLVLIFSSIILPYHFYYIITGSLLLIFCLICKLKPLFTKK